MFICTFLVLSNVKGQEKEVVNVIDTTYLTDTTINVDGLTDLQRKENQGMAIASSSLR
jgi:hypothetical protein